MKVLRRQDGFTYIMAMMLVAVMGIMLAAAGQSWKTVMQREREEELIFRGLQIRNAIERRQKPGGRIPPTTLNDLEHLVKDPRTPGTVRWVRSSVLKDPMTGEKFREIRTPDKGIVGVASTSEQESIKSGNFPKEFEYLEGKNKYSEWEFVLQPPTQPPQPIQ